jgi:hypothetical protein
MNYEQLYNNIQSYSENTEALFVASIPVFVQEAEERIYNSVQIPALRKNVTGSLTASNKYLSAPTDYLSTYSIAVIDGSGKYTYLINKDVNFIREAYPNPSAANNGLPKYYALFGAQYADINDLSFLLGPTPDASYGVEMHYFYYPPTIVQGQVVTTSIVSGGSGYANGVYQNVSLTGGSGSGATADIVISGGLAGSCTVKFGGQFYVVGDTLSCSSLGTSGAGFSVTVSAVSNSTGTSWLGDNYDPVLFYGSMREAMLFMKGEQDLIKYYEDKYTEALMQLNRLGTGLERGDAYRDGQARIPVNP